MCQNNFPQVLHRSKEKGEKQAILVNGIREVGRTKTSKTQKYDFLSDGWCSSHKQKKGVYSDTAGSLPQTYHWSPGSILYLWSIGALFVALASLALWHDSHLLV